MPYWNHDWGGWGWFGALMMILTMVLFWGGLITVVVLLLRRFRHVGPDTGGPGTGGEPYRDADRILDERFARGEIDEEELMRRRTALRRTN